MKSSKFIYFLLLIFLILSCDKKESYYFKRLNNKGETTSYFKKVVYRYNDSIIDTTYYYNKVKKLSNKAINKTISLKDGMIKNGIYYKEIKDTCTINKIYGDEFEVCYLGKTTIELSHEAFKTKRFVVTSKAIDGISYFLYFDKNNILLRREYNDGYAPYFKEDRVSKKNW